MKRYGITLEQKQERLSEQGGLCAICRTDKPGAKGTFYTDHDHATGELRGELCHHCNTAIGLMQDDAGLLRSAAAYLERYRTCPPQ